MRSFLLVVVLSACGESKKPDVSLVNALEPFLHDLAERQLPLATETDPNRKLARVIGIVRKVDGYVLPASSLACHADAAAAIERMRRALAPFRDDGPPSHVRNAELRGAWSKAEPAYVTALCELRRTFDRCVAESGATVVPMPPMAGC